MLYQLPMSNQGYLSNTNKGEYKKKLAPTHIKVFSERQEVYLMGSGNTRRG